mgnify:CR=1 FL=1
MCSRSSALRNSLLLYASGDRGKQIELYPPSCICPVLRQSLPVELDCQTESSSCLLYTSDAADE